ncbi:MAG: hypothetical protein IJT60_05125 [Clostridia bacterium]|nr:hypothetical protein [Clostridia bacterium]
MKKFTGLICLLLVLAMTILAFSACGNATDNPTGDKESSSESKKADGQDPEGETEDQDGRLKPKIPESYDFGNQTIDFLVWYVNGWEETVRMYRDIASEGPTGDKVNDAVCERNDYIEEQYKVEITLERMAQNTLVDTVKNEVLVGDCEYEVVYPRLLEFSGLLQADVFINLYETPNIDWDMPWWDQNSIDNLEIADTLYLVATSLNVNDKDATAALAFNKDKCQDFGLDFFYQDVIDGEWTYDRLMEYCEVVGDPDTNGDGNGIADEEDFWAFLGKNDVSTSFFHGSGSRIITRDEKDLFAFTIGSEDDIDAMVIIGDFMNQDYFYNHHKTGIDDTAYRHLFETNHGLFFWMRLDAVTDMRAAEVTFGILPIPKLYEDQDNYYSTVSQHTTGLLSIPTSNQNDTLYMTGMILEALAADSYYGLTKAYVDESLKTKYSSDEESRDMLTIILNSRVFDPGLYFRFGSFDTTLQDMGAKRGSLAVAVQEDTKRVNEEIRQFHEKLGLVEPTN